LQERRKCKQPSETTSRGGPQPPCFILPYKRGTYENNNNNLRSFLLFGEVFLLGPFKTTPLDVANNIAWLGKRGTIVVDILQSYMSTINMYIQYHALHRVAIGPLVSGVRKGLAYCQNDIAPLQGRVPLPVQGAYAILELAELLLRSARDGAQPRTPLLRATIAYILAYLFFNRGECSACINVGNLVISDTHITPLSRDEKDHKGRQAEHRNCRHIPTNLVLRVAAVLRGCFAF